MWSLLWGRLGARHAKQWKRKMGEADCGNVFRIRNAGESVKAREGLTTVTSILASLSLREKE
jgi:hypothetical protein